MTHEAFLREMRRLYEDAEAALADLLKSGISAAALRRKKAVLAMVEAELKRLGNATGVMFSSQLPRSYLVGARVVQDHVGWGKLLTTRNFSGLDAAAVETAFATAMTDTDFCLSQVQRTCKKLLESSHLTGAGNAAANRLVAAAHAQGGTAAELGRALQAAIDPTWFVTYKRAQDGEYFKLSGRTWRMSDYAHLNAQVRMGTTQNLGAVNWGAQHGFRFVQMTRHPGSCKLCAPWQGKVYSTIGRALKDHTGVTRRPLTDVPGNGGLLHPYCRHSFSPWGLPDPERALDIGDPKTAAAATRHADKPVNGAPDDAGPAPGALTKDEKVRKAG